MGFRLGHRQAGQLRRAHRAADSPRTRVSGAARQVGVCRVRRRRLRRLLRAQALFHAPGPHRARQGPVADRAPVGDHRPRLAASGASCRDRGHAHLAGGAPGVSRAGGGSHLPGRSAGQSDDAFSERPGSVEDAEGPAAADEVFPGRMSRGYRLLAVATLGLAFVVVVVGAYVRLSDAGLGCPDWPLCYGRPVPSDMAGDALARAWKEMGHRYLAGTLGVLIIALALLSWKLRRSPWLATSIVALVVFQATLGAWTVTMLLKPAIVTAHLVGGMTILGALTWLAVSQFDRFSTSPAPSLRVPAAAALCAIAVQIALGGWVSSNYAALACPDVPLCLGQALPPMDFA